VASLVAPPATVPAGPLCHPGPLLSVLLFLSAIAVAITYLRFEELEREQEAVTRDVEYAQQRIRLRLLERQEQLMRLAREVDNKEIGAEEFEFQAETLISQFPELQAISWMMRAAWSRPATHRRAPRWR
jgi:hypothetical protein